MGEVADMILNGLLCEECGVFVGEGVIIAHGGIITEQEILKEPGFPLKCRDCKRQEKKAYES